MGVGEIPMKILLSFLFLVASCSQAVAHCGGPGVADHMRLRAAAPLAAPPLPMTDADLDRAEHVAPRPHSFAEDLAGQLRVRDDGAEIFGSHEPDGRVHEGVSA